MPLYEYRCKNCRKLSTFRWSYQEYESAQPRCTYCQSEQVQRAISRVRVARSEESRLESLADPSSFAGVDENDPKSIGRFMRRMGQEMGEDMGDDFSEVVSRLESGEDPDAIEKDFPDLGGGEGDSGMGSPF